MTQPDTYLDEFRARLAADLEQRRLKAERTAAIRASLDANRRYAKAQHHPERLRRASAGEPSTANRKESS